MAKHGGDQTRPTVKPRLSTEQIEWMFAHIFRLPDIADLAFPSLRPELFNTGTEPHYNVLWGAALEIYRKQGTKAFENIDYAYAVIELEILTRVRSQPGVLNTEFYNKLLSRKEGEPGLLLWLFDLVKPTELTPQWGKELLRDFRLEREVSDVFADLIKTSDTKTIVNLPEVLEKLTEKHTAINSQVSE